jgi:hypothetical protein
MSSLKRKVALNTPIANRIDPNNLMSNEKASSQTQYPNPSDYKQQYKSSKVACTIRA